MRTLMICGNTIQVISAIRLRQTLFKDDYLAIVIMDTLSNSKSLVERIVELGLANEAVEFKNSFVGTGYRKSFKIQVGSESIPKESELKEYNFDRILAGNIYGVTELYFAKIKKYSPDFYFLMDGVFNYVEEGMRQFIMPSHMERIKHPIVNSIKGQYIFSKEYGVIYSGFLNLEVQELTRLKDVEKKQFNFVFDFDSNIIPSDCRAIYFEQAFLHDGINMNDIELLKPYVDKFGKDTLYIKKHPRSRQSAFESEGYKILEDRGMPFEILCMNADISKMTFITLGSTAAVTPFLFLKEKYRAYYLYKLRIESYKKLEDNYLFFCRKVEELVSEQKDFYFPESMDEYHSMLGN